MKEIIEQLKDFYHVWSEQRLDRRRFDSHRHSEAREDGDTSGRYHVVCVDCDLNHQKWAAHFCKDVRHANEDPYQLEERDCLEQNLP